MKNDITTPEVKDVLVAAVPRKNGHEEELWDIYIVNRISETMEDVHITRRGDEEGEGGGQSSAGLHHLYQRIGDRDHR